MVDHSSPPIHCLVVQHRHAANPIASRLLADAHTLGMTNVIGLEYHDLYFIAGSLQPADLELLATELLSDAALHEYTWRRAGTNNATTRADHSVIESTLRAGVTDPVAAHIVRGARMLGIDGVRRAATGQRYCVHGDLSEAELKTLAVRLLTNPVVQRFSLGEIEPVIPQPGQADGGMSTIPLVELTADELLQLSHERRAALNLVEMQAIQSYYRNNAGREPSDVEFETIAQTWSEHCVHKTFKARISIQEPEVEEEATASHHQNQIPLEINNLLETYLRAATETIAAPWVRSAFVDNAGVIEFDNEYEISFKVETHNHPSALEPFGGANTGVGGVIRDILGVSHRPIAATDVLCFGPQDVDPQTLPQHVLHPRRIRSGVVSGVEDYGNKSGLPVVNGAILYDHGYTANPLVFCGCVGLAPKDSHPRQPHPGDRIIVLGGRTGRDGLRGATFSSLTMDTHTSEIAGASVQIGDPITEKGLIEVITRARDQQLYHAITDCGAGGFSSAVGEMSNQSGAEVDLASVQLKYPGLAAWEIWLSEAQERMLLAVPKANTGHLQSLCDIFDIEFTDIGIFTDTGRLVVYYGDQLVLELENEFLHEGLPQQSISAQVEAGPRLPLSPSHSLTVDFRAVLLKLLAHPNIASKADVIRVYDHEVQGGTVVKPLTGKLNDGPSDACVLKPMGVKGLRGIVLSNGINPQMGKYDAYNMALSVIDEAIRNAVAVGADPDRIALLDNFCWGDPTRPKIMGTLVEAARGCHDAAIYYRTPFISGKDSLNNEYLGEDGKRHAIPPTLLISAIGIIADVRQAITMDAKTPGDVIYLLGETRLEFGGSHFNLVDPNNAIRNSEVPSMPSHARALYHALHKAIRAGVVRACHDLSEGGLSVAAAEMCIAGRLGMDITLETDDAVTALFSESNGRFLVEVRPKDCATFEAHFDGALAAQQRNLGVVTDADSLTITNHEKILMSVVLPELVAAWNHTVN